MDVGASLDIIRGGWTMLLHVGDLVKMRKAHPCGNDVWRITYVGADIKMR